MKSHIKTLVITSALMLNAAVTHAGLDWSYGSLGNADNISRHATSVAYSSNGTVFVAGTEESSSGNFLIVTKKFSPAGLLLGSVTNTYFSNGSPISDYVKSISLDASGNVYVLGAQYTGASRGEDIVLIKYNSSLTLQWKSYIYNSAYPNNDFNDVPAGLVFDGSGNIYVTGMVVNEGIPDQTTIFVRKYNPSGTVIYTAHIGEPAATRISNAGDMCMDASDNITVTAKAVSVLFGTHSIMYARVTNSGIMSWQKFNAVPSNYSIFSEPHIECTSAGTLYMGATLSRPGPNSDYFSRHIAVKLNLSGTKLWEVLSPDLNQGANSFMLHLDASENIYTGGDFVAAHGSPFSNYRIYKFNSSGVLLWAYTSPENSAYMRFEKYSTSALFVASQIGSTGPVKLRKLNAQNGVATWTEDITSTAPPGYIQSSVSLSALAVNKLTSEVVFCGNLSGDVALPNPATEDRWHIRKYGATSPRFACEPQQNSLDDVQLDVLPNPATDFINVKCSKSIAGAGIFVMDLNGSVFREIKCREDLSEQRIPLNELEPGIYFVKVLWPGCINNAARVTIRKIVIHKL